MVHEVIRDIHLNLWRKVVCVYNPRVTDALCFSHDHVHHFIPNQFVLSWLAGIPLENGLVSRAYVHVVEACKVTCGRRK